MTPEQMQDLLGFEVLRVDPVQELWSGYGCIYRVHVQGFERPSVMVKYIDTSAVSAHPRGWQTNRSHLRKQQSYRVEVAWYQNHAGRCGAECRVPQFYRAEQRDNQTLLVMEDLQTASFTDEPLQESSATCAAVVAWLAWFHASYVGYLAPDLWSQGTYWHLATRPDELTAMPASELKQAAHWIDSRLAQARWKTLVHGDAKQANFCFHADGTIAAVDFQYVGGGIGVQDLAYFLSSCLSADALQQQESRFLTVYFRQLRQALVVLQPTLSEEDREDLVTEWQQLYAMAWADFSRFLQGWSPGHWKLHDYSDQLVNAVLADWRREGSPT